MLYVFYFFMKIRLKILIKIYIETIYVKYSYVLISEYKTIYNIGLIKEEKIRINMNHIYKLNTFYS
jgi:hypothetical protein